LAHAILLLVVHDRLQTATGSRNQNENLSARQFAFANLTATALKGALHLRLARLLLEIDIRECNCAGGVANWDPGPGGEIWEIGYDPERWNQVPEPQTLATVIRDGNWDFLTRTQHWYTTPGGFTLPNSMYLTSAPAFFGSNRWPWTDPATGTIFTLPAKARYDASEHGTTTRENPIKLPW
jgi:hypothetical protein